MSIFGLARMTSHAALRCAVPTVIGLVGCRGLVLDASSGASPPALLRMHALFGALLCASILARFYGVITTTDIPRKPNMRGFARQEARKVYLLLYGLMGFEQCIGLATHVRQPPEAFQVYLAYGVLALLVIYLLAKFNHHAAC